MCKAPPLLWVIIIYNINIIYYNKITIITLYSLLHLKSVNFQLNFI